MNVELLYFDGCPSHEPLLVRLRELVEGAGRDEEVRLVRVESDDEARATRFLGSPTVRVDDRDVEPTARSRTDFGLKCRLYPTPAGLSATPPGRWILDAIAERQR